MDVWVHIERRKENAEIKELDLNQSILWPWRVGY